MPMYEFFCGECSHPFESIETLGTKVSLCPICRKEAKKVMSTSNFKINGYSEANGYSNKGKEK